MSSTREYSPQAVYLMAFVSLVGVKILSHVLGRPVNENYSFSFSCLRTDTALTSPGGKTYFLFRQVLKSWFYDSFLMNFFKDVYQALDILDANKGRMYLGETFVNRSLSHMGRGKKLS